MRASFHHHHHHQHDDEMMPCLFHTQKNSCKKGRASFQLFKKKAGRHQKVAGRRALQKRPRQNTAYRSRNVFGILYVYTYESRKGLNHIPLVVLQINNRSSYHSYKINLFALYAFISVLFLRYILQVCLALIVMLLV